MEKMTQTWKIVKTQPSSVVKAVIGPVSIPTMSSMGAKMYFTYHGEVNFLEHVQAHVIDSSIRGDLASLSPMATLHTTSYTTVQGLEDDQVLRKV